MLRAQTMRHADGLREIPRPAENAGLRDDAALVGNR